MRLVSLLAAVAALAVAQPASAALVYSASTVVIGPTRWTADTGSTSLNIPTPGFATQLGVLIGASFSLEATVRSRSVLSAAGPFLVGAEGISSAGASVSGPGFAPIELGHPFAHELDTMVSCLGIGSCGAASPTAVASLAGSRTIDPSALGSYLGGPALVATVSSTAGCGGFGLSECTDTVITEMNAPAGSATFEYDYLLHSAASFSADTQLGFLKLDLGQITQGGPGASLGFNIFNRSADPANTTGLDLDSVSAGTGDTSVLTTNIGAFSNLAAGTGAGFTAFLDSSTVGAFGATYLVRLSDADFGVGQQDETLVLRLVGQVVAPPPPPSSVPEPAAWALMLVGFGLVGGAVRGRRTVTARGAAGAALGA